MLKFKCSSRCKWCHFFSGIRGHESCLGLQDCQGVFGVFSSFVSFGLPWFVGFIYLFLEGSSFSTSADKMSLLTIRIGMLVGNQTKTFLKVAMAQNISHASTLLIAWFQSVRAKKHLYGQHLAKHLQNYALKRGLKEASSNNEQTLSRSCMMKA